ncbi:hypothetical protein GW916_05055 [bacterium]|nr:hypothetical protein [bacterium]
MVNSIHLSLTPIFALLFFCELSFAALWGPAKEQDRFRDCSSSKEFLTSSEFLKKERIFPVHSDEIQNLSLKIIEGCDGSAQRFIQVFTTLDKAGFVRKKAIETALMFTKKTDVQAKTFCLVFQKSYLKKYLDLSAADAFKLASDMIQIEDGATSPAASDFEETVAFCVGDRRLTLPKKYCASQAIQLAKISGEYGESLFDDLKDLVLWFIERNEKDFPAPKAFSQAFEIVKFGPRAKDNFLKTLKYLNGESGPKMKPDEAFQLALKVSQLSTEKKSTPEKKL